MSASLTNRGITIFDADGRGGVATAVLRFDVGEVVAVAGDSGVGIDDSNIGALVFTGMMSQLDNLFRGRTTGTIIYTRDASGAVVFTLDVTDEDGLTTHITFNGTVADFAEPVVSVPGGSISYDINTAKNLHGIGFSVVDSDDNNGYATMVFAISQGTISINEGNSGCSVTANNGTGSVTVVGTSPSLSKLLAASGGSTGTIQATTTVVGSVTVTVTVTDSQGQVGSNTRSGTAGAAPVVTFPAGYIAIPTSVSTNLHGVGFGVTDVDASGSTNTCTMAIAAPITVVVGTSGVTNVTGSGTGLVTFQGTIAQINNLLTGGGTGTLKVINAVASTHPLTVSVLDTTGRTSNIASVDVVFATGTTWTTYAQATPSPTDVAISNFVVPIDLSFLSAAWWAAVSPDGRDIRVTDSSNTQVPADLVPGSFNYSLKYGLMYAKIANNTAGSQPTLRVWCGASNASALAHGATYGSDAVYDTSIIKAWWPSGQGADRTANANDLTMTGAPSVPSAGDITRFTTTYNGSSQYGKATAAIEDNVPEQFAAFVVPNNTGIDKTYVSSCHGTIRNLLGQNSSKVRGKTDIQGGTDNAVFSGSNLAPGAYNFAFATFYSASIRQAGRNAFVPTSDTGTSTGVAGADAYIVGGMGTDVAGTVNVVADGSFTIGLTMIFKFASADVAKFNAWMKNYAGAYSQPVYWGAWADGTGSVMGL